MNFFLCKDRQKKFHFLAKSSLDISQTGKKVKELKRQTTKVSKFYSQQSPNDVVGFTLKSQFSISERFYFHFFFFATSKSNEHSIVISHLFAGGNKFSIFTCCSFLLFWIYIFLFYICLLACWCLHWNLKLWNFYFSCLLRRKFCNLRQILLKNCKKGEIFQFSTTIHQSTLLNNTCSDESEWHKICWKRGKMCVWKNLLLLCYKILWEFFPRKNDNVLCC